MVPDGSVVVQVLTPAQAAVMFTLAQDELVEPLHITNILALNRGVIQLLPMCRRPQEGGSGESTDCLAACDPVDSDGVEGGLIVPPPVMSPSTAVPS